MQRAHLTELTRSMGFKILQGIMQEVCDEFTTALLNANPGNPAEVVAAHSVAKSAAQFYTRVVNRMNEEVLLYTHSPRVSDTPKDFTEGVLDLGDGPYI